MTSAVASLAAPALSRASAQGPAERLVEALEGDPAADRLRAARRRLESGRSAIERVDLADTELPIAALLELAWNGAVPPPVSARVGDRRSIACRGRAGLGGAAALCAGLGAARPMILESTYTETVAADAGDVVYRPATVEGAGGRRRLSLFTRGAAWPRPADPTRPWFAPFALVETDCDFTPLCRLHRCRAARSDRRVEYVADRLLEDPQRLRLLLSIALATAGDASFPGAGVSYLCGGLVDAAGAPRRGTVTRVGRMYSIGGQRVGHDELVDRLLLPLEMVSSGVVDQPHLVHDPGTLVPVLSGPLRRLLLAQTAPTSCPAVGAVSEQLVWRVGGCRTPAAPGRAAGRTKAGLKPGSKSGSAAHTGVSRGAQRLFQRAAHHAQVPPTLLLTIPTAPFDLLPDKSNRLDYALVRELSRQLARTPDDKVEQTVSQWYARRADSLSPSYRARLGAKPQSEQEAVGADAGAQVALFPEFLATTCRRACRVVAALNREARA
jgi:uncharacterized protein DUF6025